MLVLFWNSLWPLAFGLELSDLTRKGSRHADLVLELTLASSLWPWNSIDIIIKKDIDLTLNFYILYLTKFQFQIQSQSKSNFV